MDFQLRIDQQIALRFSQLRIAVLVLKGIKNSNMTSHTSDWQLYIDGFLSSVSSEEEIKELLPVKIWRDTYQLLGVKIKKFKPTNEALLRRVFKSKVLPNVNPAVNAYLASQLMHFFPVGGYDIDHLNGPVTLRFSPGDEKFFPIGSKSSDPTTPGEVVYADERSVLTRNWSYRDCDASKITEESKNIVLMIEAPTDDIADTELKKAIEHVRSTVMTVCGGSAELFFVTAAETLEKRP
jgi:DNA/RNA-binding domain of Phe-tRNA-synthetase-like protein